MDNNENNGQGFTPDDDGYTKAPDSQQNGGFGVSGQQNEAFQSSNQYSGQQMNGQFYQGQGAAPQQKEQKGFAIAGMVLGIISLVCCCSPFLGVITGILGLIFSIIVLVQKRPGRGMAIAGIICAAIGLILSVCMYFVNASALDYINSQGGIESLMKDFDAYGVK